MRRNPWFKAGFDAWSLGIEASQVIALRTMKIALGGPGSQAEAKLMVDEKIAAGIALQALALTGGLGTSVQSASAKTIQHYRRKVRANRRRLTKI